LVVKPLLMRLFGGVYHDMQRMEAVVRASATDWTIIQPARLTDGPRTSTYRVAIGRSVPNGWVIRRADVADYMVRQVAAPNTYRTAVALAY